MDMRWCRIAGRCAVMLVGVSLLAGCSPRDAESNESHGEADGINAVKGALQEDGDSQRDDGLPQHLEKVPVLIRHEKGGEEKRLSIELALTQGQQEKGLMHRTELARGDGMLFPFLPPRNVSFWMKHTQVPLDLIFISPDGRVARVAAQAKPNDPTPIFADVPVAGVLELRGGDALALGIREGDWIGWGRCTEQPGQSSTQEASFCQSR